MVSSLAIMIFACDLKLSLFVLTFGRLLFVCEKELPYLGSRDRATTDQGQFPELPWIIVVPTADVMFSKLIPYFGMSNPI